MEIMYLNKLKEKLGVPSDNIEGFTEDEIVELENNFGISFPKAYKEFLF